MSRHVVVVGGGHNGLIAANYIAREGHRVTLLEARDKLGGAAGRVEFMPGYSSSITNSIGSFEGRIFEELQLDSFGLRFHQPSVTLLHPTDDGLIIGWRDKKLIAEQMDSFAPGEAQRHEALIEKLDNLGKSSGLSLWNRPSSGSQYLENMQKEQREKFVRTILEGSLMDLLDESLHTPQVKSMMMMLALNGQLLSPRAPGSAFGLLLRPISRASGTSGLLGNQEAALRGSVGLPIGSMGSIIDALTSSAHALGVNIRLRSRVEELIIGDQEKVEAVKLESGEVITNVDAVITTIEPSCMMELFSSDLKLNIEKPKGSAFKIAIALDGLPTVDQGDNDYPVEKLLEAQFRIGPSPEYIEAAVEDGLAGRASEAPIIWGLIPTIASPGLAPFGKHLLSLNVWHAPYDLGKKYWDEHGDRFVESCIRELKRLMPNLDQYIESVAWFSPHDLEEELLLTSSNITHGDMTPDLMFNDRPGVGIPDKLAEYGVYVGGAGTWPGGYVTGAPGRNAATSVIHQLTKESN